VTKVQSVFGEAAEVTPKVETDVGIIVMRSENKSAKTKIFLFILFHLPSFSFLFIFA
jgi:hypothetical protein